MIRTHALVPTFSRAMVILSVVCLGVGCAAEQKGAQKAGVAKAVGTPGPTQAAMFEHVKSLAGEWVMPGEDGKIITASVYSVTANGSAVREIMFPGQPHEMTNVYHMDGPSVVVTHYCGAGNQPRMRATAPAADGSIAFKFDSVTNLETPTTMYMGGLTLRMPDKNHLVQEWSSIANGKDQGEHAVFKMTRKGT